MRRKHAGAGTTSPERCRTEWARSDSYDRAIIVVERYADKETAYASVHKSSEAFKKFRPQLAALEPVITGHSYVASDIGYTSRRE